MPTRRRSPAGRALLKPARRVYVFSLTTAKDATLPKAAPGLKLPPPTAEPWPPSHSRVVAAGARIVVSHARLPIVDVTYPPNVSVETFRESFCEYAKLAGLKRPLGYLLDMRRFNPLFAPAAVRKSAAEVFHEFAPVLKPVSVCEARVVTSELTRGIITAFDWLSGTKWPCATFTDLEKAHQWVVARLRERGVQV